jgi:putative transposase
MKSRRYSEEQIVRILGEIGSGRSVAETARQYGVAEATIYRWREKFGGMEVSEVRRLRELEAENARLRRIVAQQAMDLDALKELLRGKW